MSAPCSGIHPTAVIGQPAERRDERADRCSAGVFADWSGGVTIDSTALIEALVTVDAGIKEPTRIGARTWLMKKVHVAHDVVIGADCELAPLVTLGGWIEIGDRVKIGLGAVLKPRVKIGNDAVIGCGAVVIRDVPAGETWVGNPAKPIHQGVLSEWEEWWELSRR